MCEYSGIDDAQRYTKEELTPEEIERRIRGIIKVGRDVKLKLGMPMFENGSCPEVNYHPCRHHHLLFEILYLILFSLQIFTLPPLELGPIVCYPRLKELTDDEEEPASSPIKKRKAPLTVEMLDLLTKCLWRKNLRQLCIIEFMVLAGAYVVLAEGLLPAIHHLLYAHC
jgi:hypothetical protein